MPDENPTPEAEKTHTKTEMLAEASRLAAMEVLATMARAVIFSLGPTHAMFIVQSLCGGLSVMSGALSPELAVIRRLAGSVTAIPTGYDPTFHAKVECWNDIIRASFTHSTKGFTPSLEARWYFATMVLNLLTGIRFQDLPDPALDKLCADDPTIAQQLMDAIKAEMAKGEPS